MRNSNLPKHVQEVAANLEKDISNPYIRVSKKLIGETPDHISMWKSLEQRHPPFYDDLWDWGFLESASNAIDLPAYRYRIWFLCPHCSKRVAVLYGVGKFFYCRKCHGLTYASQRETEPFRFMRKARKIRKRLGANMNLAEPIIDKPKNMHRKTFQILKQKAQIANYLSWKSMGDRLGIDI